MESIIVDSVIVYDKTINAADSVSRTVLTNANSTAPTNLYDKKAGYKMDCYIQDTVLLVIIFLFTIAVICYYHAKHMSKLKLILSY